MLGSTTDEQFAHKLYSGLKDEGRFSKPKLSQTAFTLSHYAGDVTHESENFLDKNKDFFIQEHEDILARGSHEELKSMFASSGDETDGSNRSKSSTKFKSVSARFKKQLGELMLKLNATEPHFIRCIKPNAESKPSSFESANVLQQLRCGGVLEAIRISCAGYPSRKNIEVLSRDSVFLHRERRCTLKVERRKPWKAFCAPRRWKDGKWVRRKCFGSGQKACRRHD